MAYKTVVRLSENMTYEKRSRFVGQLYPVSSEAEVKGILTQEKKANHQANHHCWAYRLAGEQVLERYSDDGEPSGTAGMPMLEVLRGQGLENILTLSIRYFGGTKLGTGGLVRAYTQSVQQVISKSEMVEVALYIDMQIQVSYHLTGKVTHFVKCHNLIIHDIIYGESIIHHLYVEAAREEIVKASLIELTSGSCTFKVTKSFEGYLMDGKMIKAF